MPRSGCMNAIRSLREDMIVLALRSSTVFQSRQVADVSFLELRAVVKVEAESCGQLVGVMVDQRKVLCRDVMKLRC